MQFGRYRLEQLLGEGGMGQVFRGYDTGTERVVAVKVLRTHTAADPMFRERFRREAKAAAALADPHVVPIFDYGEIEGRLFICMQYLDGEGIDALLARSGPMAVEAAVSVLTQAAAALQAAHAAGLVHRDVKPSNLFITTNGSVYLIDFGIARAAGETGLTTTGATIGTFAYMAPERFTTGVVDARADVYALACVLFELLTGHTPFPVSSVEQQIAAHLTQAPPQPSLVRPDLGIGFDAVIAKGMARDPDDRYQQIIDLANAAVAAAGSGAQAAADPARRTTTVPARPSRSSSKVAVARRLRLHSSRGRLRTEAVVGLVVSVLVVTGALVTGAWMLDQHGSASTPSRGDAPKTLAAPKTFASHPTASINLGITTALGIVVDSGRHVGYVTVLADDRGGGAVIAIDMTTRRVTATIPVGKESTGVATDPRAHTAIVAHHGDRTVSVIDTDTHTVTATLTVGNSPDGVAIDTDMHMAYVTNAGGERWQVSLIDTLDPAVVAAVPVGTLPTGLAVDPRTHAVYVANNFDGTVSVIDGSTHAVTATIPVGVQPSKVAVDPDSHTAYVTNTGSGTVSVIDTVKNAVTATIPVGKSPRDIAVDPADKTAYVVNSETVSVINTDTRTVSATVNITGFGEELAVDPQTHTAYVVDSFGTVEVIERT